MVNMNSSSSRRNTRPAWIAGSFIAFVVILFLFLPRHISTSSDASSLQNEDHKEEETVTLHGTPATLGNTNSKYAYGTLLGKDALHVNETDINEDMYFVSMRTLGWSLLHAKDTRSHGIPFIVLAVPGVNPKKVERLEKDGAIVIHVEPVDVPDWVPPPMIITWQDVWMKLRVWELEQFEKVLFLDADIIVAGRLDIIFETTLTQTTDMDRAVDLDHPATIPPDYVFCAGIETSVEHHFPPTTEELEKGQYINAGVFVARPSIAMLNHYLAVLNTPNSFNPIVLEQNLLNQVHRKDGAMPFQQLAWEYAAYRPTQQDVDGGALSYHAKFWKPDHQELTPYLNSFRWRAMGFYEAWDELNKT